MKILQRHFSSEGSGAPDGFRFADQPDPNIWRLLLLHPVESGFLEFRYHQREHIFLNLHLPRHHVSLIQDRKRHKVWHIDLG